MPNGQGPTEGASKLPLPIRSGPPSKMASPRRPPRRSPSKASATPRRSSSHPPQNINRRNDDHDRNHDHGHGQPIEAQTPVNNNIFRASAPPAANARYSIRTPGSQVADFRASSRQPLSASAGRSKGAGYAPPTQFTPHGRAAIRALDIRRAAIDQINTPGRNRRRSMRDQRETPRDVLRALSKTLAPKSKVITTSSSSSPDDPLNPARSQRRRNSWSRSQGRKKAAVVIPENPDDSDDEFPIDRPRFSLPIDEDADSDGDLPRPPRSSGLEDLEDNFTMQSIEMPRRATMGPQRYSLRMSDYGPMGDPQSDNDDVGIDSAFFPRANWEDDTGDGTGMGGQDDATVERLDDEAARRDTMGGRISDFGEIGFNLDAGDQSTVVLAPQVQSSPEREGFSPDNEPFEPFGFDDGPPPLGDDEPPLDNEPPPFDDEPPPFDNEPPPLDDEPLPLDEEMDIEQNLTLDHGVRDGDEDVEIGDLAAQTIIARQTSKSAQRVKRPGKRISRHGIEYPSLPTSVVKRLAQKFAGKTKISADTLSTIMQASDWFFEQLGDDLRAYANHAKGRTTINESDMLTLMRRYVPFHTIFSIYTRVSFRFVHLMLSIQS